MIRTLKTLDAFFAAHPELTVIRNNNGNVVKICFPIEATRTSYTIVNDSVQIFYMYKGESIVFSEY